MFGPETIPLTGKYCLRWWNILTVEPTSLLFYSAIYMSQSMESMLLVRKACHELLEDGTCVDEVHAQTVVSGIDIWKPTLRTILSAFIGLYLGVLTDKYPKLIKTLIYIPIGGQILCDISNCVNIYFWDWTPVTAALCESLIPGLTGSFLSVTVTTACYIIQITTTENRTKRLMYLFSTGAIGSAIGTTSSGYAADYIGLINGYIICITFNLLGIIIGLFLIKIPTNLEPGISSCNTNAISSYVKLITSKEKNERKIIILTALGYVFSVMVLSGEGTVIYLYTRYAFDWSDTEYSTYTFCKQATSFLGTVLSVELLQRYFSMEDLSTMIIQCFVTVIASCVLVFVNEAWELYIVSFFQLFLNSTSSIAFSLGTKQFSAEDYGKACSLFGIMQGSSSISFPIYNRIYQLSFTSMPGAYFSVSVVLVLLALLSFRWAYQIKNHAVSR